MAYLIILVTIIIILIYNIIIKRRNLPPGPWNLPIIGYLLWLNPTAPYLTLSKLARKYGKIYGLYLGSVYTVVITDTQLIRKIFNKDGASGRAPLYLTHGIMQGYGLICAEGELWRDQRKFVHTVLRNFGAAKVGLNRSRMEQLILEHVNDSIEFLKTNNENPLDPLVPLRHSLGSAISKIVFGRCWSRDDSLWIWLQNLQEEGTKLIGVAGGVNFLPLLRFLPNQKKNINFIVEGLRETHKVYQKFIDEEKKKFDLSTDPVNLIQAFLKEKSKRVGTADEFNFYHDKQFHYLLADIFGASLDTTLTTLRWFILYMASYPEVQRKMRAEIFAVLGKNQPRLEDMAVLPYVEATIAETQRIRSVVPIGIPHGTVEKLEISGYQIPKGSMIVPLQWAIHMDEQIWKDPHVFQPERFINADGQFSRPEDFIPFQVGKRMCVGDELARMFLFLFTTSIVQNFDISSVSKIDLTGYCGITLTPKSNQLIRFRTVV